MDKKFEIEKDIPVPKRGRKHKYPFESMQVGDSFVFADPYTRAAQSRASCALCGWKKHSSVEGVKDRMYITRKVGDVLRVWRLI